jgi:hypothetical protein
LSWEVILADFPSPFGQTPQGPLHAPRAERYCAICCPHVGGAKVCMEYLIRCGTERSVGNPSWLGQGPPRILSKKRFRTHLAKRRSTNFVACAGAALVVANREANKHVSVATEIVQKASAMDPTAPALWQHACCSAAVCTRCRSAGEHKTSPRAFMICRPREKAPRRPETAILYSPTSSRPIRMHQTRVAARDG